MAPLYEYRNMAGKFYYSIKSDLQGMKPSAGSICYVWNYPSSIVALDYEAKPVHFIK